MFLIYGGDKELIVKGYVDASFDTDPDDCKSQTGYVFTLNGGAVSWCSSKQSVVAGSVGFRSNFKKIPTHTQDHVMHSNERGECCLRTLVDRSRSVDAT